MALLFDNTLANFERINGRPPTWWERVGFAWDAITTRNETPALRDYAGPWQGQLTATGDVADALSGTAYGQTVGQAAEGVTDTAQATGETLARLGKPGWLALAAILAGLWIWSR